MYTVNTTSHSMSTKYFWNDKESLAITKPNTSNTVLGIKEKSEWIEEYYLKKRKNQHCFETYQQMFYWLYTYPANLEQRLKHPSISSKETSLYVEPLEGFRKCVLNKMKLKVSYRIGWADKIVTDSVHALCEYMKQQTCEYKGFICFKKQE